MDDMDGEMGRNMGRRGKGREFPSGPAGPLGIGKTTTHLIGGVMCGQTSPCLPRLVFSLDVTFLEHTNIIPNRKGDPGEAHRENLRWRM